MRTLLARCSLLLLVVVPCAVLALNFSRDLIAGDVDQYLSVARSVREGLGLKTSILFYEEHYLLGAPPVSQTVFPPGYPLMIAAVAMSGLSMHEAAFLICVAAFALCTLLIVSICRGDGHSWSLALLAGLVWSGSVPAGVNVLLGGSDVPFTAVTLLAAWSIQRMATAGRMWGFMAGCAAAVAVSIRYAGLFFVFALCAVMVVRALRLRSRRSLAEMALAVVPPVAMLLLLFVRNLLLVGDAKGGNAYEVATPPSEVVRVLLWGAQGLIGYSRPGFADGRAAEVTLLIVLVGLAACAWKGRPVLRTTSSKLRDGSVSALCLAYPSISLAFLWYLGSTRHLGLDSRMLLPLLPFVVLLVLGWSAQLTWTTPCIDSRSVVVLLAALYMLGQAQLPPPLWAIDRATEMRALRSALVHDVAVREVLAQERAAGRPVLTNAASGVGVILQQPVVGLTPRDYTPRTWTAEEVAGLIRQLGVRRILFFPGIESFEDSASGAPVFFQELRREEIPRWLVPAGRGRDIVMLDVRGPPL